MEVGSMLWEMEGVVERDEPLLVLIVSPSTRPPNVLSPAPPLIANSVNVLVLKLAWV